MAENEGDGEDLPEIDPAALARAEAALAGLADSYLAWAQADAARIAACLDALRSDPGGPAAHLAQMFRIAHDMKGQAATFGYPLVSEIANRLCRLLQRDGEPAAPEIRQVAAHVEALVQAVGQRLAGDGGEVGRRLLVGLDE